MYLFVAGTMFAFTACGGGETATEEAASDPADVIAAEQAASDAEEIVQCADNCQKACCLGCKATEGEASCSLLAAGDHSCCAVKVESTEEEPEDSHEEHDHSDEAHSH